MRKAERIKLKRYLDGILSAYNHSGFIPSDPISIPHRYTLQQDIEIAGFFAAIFAWGNRTTIIKKCSELMTLMDNAPYAFISGHQETDLKRFLAFKHRTFNATDLLHLIRFLHFHYTQGYRSWGQTPTLETAFSHGILTGDENVEHGLAGFHHYCFHLEDSPIRTRKHISTPENNSSCKRLNMYLRWMVRKDGNGVDFGIWRTIKPAQLICPLDVHVQRVACHLGLIQQEKSDWKTAIELTRYLKQLDPDDPVKYDIALFGLGVNG